MAKELWDAIRKRRRVNVPNTRNVVVRGLIFTYRIPVNGDGLISTEWFRREEYSVNVSLSLRDSPILPTGMPKPKPGIKTHCRPEHSYFIRKSISPALSCSTRIQGSGKNGNEKIDAKFEFCHYCGPGWSRRDFIADRYTFENVDVVAIWFDRSAPKTLHNAIYKVRISLYM
jgi:hypothetical protein